jgi:phosphoglycerate dehydrogenase-like enzyme
MGEILAAPCASSSSSPSSSSRGERSSHAPSERDGRVAWLHSGSAGVEHILAVPRVRDAVAPLTNARGAFSASLGEWALFASSWFAKKVHAMRASQAKGEWMRDTVGMLQGKTMSIVGYGDIGRACAVRAKAFGMKVVALRRDPSKARSTSNWSPYDRGGVVNAVP